MSSTVDIRHFHLFCGLGGGATGFNNGDARVGAMQAQFRCLGGIDSDAGAIADFGHLAGVPGTVLDLFDRHQYKAWHGHEPPADWREATPADIQRAAGNERPHIVFTSAPCKGFSGLLSKARSTSDRYQALNALTLRGVWLTLEAWADDPPEFILFENVPRIATRGRQLLDRIQALLHRYGYATAETTHDCGELGGLAQSRRRFLLVARHQDKVPPFLYEPQKRPLRGVGEILEQLPIPGDESAGPMHRLPSLQWRTWVRLALVEAGGDWRSLQRLRVENGVLADYGIVPESRPLDGRFSVADPRAQPGAAQYQQYGVNRWDQTAGVVTGHRSPGQGRFSIADPRPNWNRHSNNYRVIDHTQPAPTVIGGGKGVQGGQLSIADPRHHGPAKHSNEYRIVRWTQPNQAITSAHGTGQCISDPRVGWGANRKNYQTGGHYGVTPWASPSYAVPGKAKHDRGHWSVADPRAASGQSSALPDATDRGVYIIRSLDNTWHRPFTTLELAALQGLVDPDEHLQLHGNSNSAWRERIGNAVPAPAAAAIAGVMGRTLLLAWSGETFVLDAMPIWVRPVAVALSVDSSTAGARA